MKPIPTLWYDVACPFAYAAALRLLARGIRATWRPILLGGLLRDLGVAADPNAAMPASKRRAIREDAVWQVGREGRTIRLTEDTPRSLAAMRLCVAAPDAVRPELSLALWAVFWEEGRDIADGAVLAEIARRHGVDPALVDDPGTKAALHASTTAAREAGVFGVPTLQVGDRLDWGADRMYRVERALGLPTEDPLARRPAAPPTGRVLRLYHDFASPFSYLGVTGAGELAAGHGRTLELVPILLGALFKAIGTPDVPLLTFSEARRQWTLRDLYEQAELRGVPFRFPSRFPMRTVRAARVAHLEPAATLPIYRAAWADDVDVSEPGILADVLDAAGFDGRALVEAAGSPDAKQRLRDATDAATSAGVFGVPTFSVDGDLVWGQDRHLRVAERMERG